MAERVGFVLRVDFCVLISCGKQYATIANNAIFTVPHCPRLPAGSGSCSWALPVAVMRVTSFFIASRHGGLWRVQPMTAHADEAPYPVASQTCNGQCSGFGTRSCCPPLIVLAMRSERSLPLQFQEQSQPRVVSDRTRELPRLEY